MICVSTWREIFI